MKVSQLVVELLKHPQNAEVVMYDEADHQYHPVQQALFDENDAGEPEVYFVTWPIAEVVFDEDDELRIALP